MENKAPGMDNDASLMLGGLNINAASFVPNINAAVFIPSFMSRSVPVEPAVNNQEVAEAPETKSSSTTESSPSVEALPSAIMDESPVNPPPVDSWEEEADKETEEDQKADLMKPDANHADGCVGGDGGGSSNVQDQDDAEAEGDGEVDSDGDCDGATESASKAKQKAVTDLEENKSKKEHINVIFIGHVDAGKSTIGGQIMYLTGMVDKRTLEKYEREAREKNRESWYLSWALDTNQEEREKGKTVEVGRACFETEKKHFTILDAPGHKSFVPNMIGGASQADLAVLVISARKGEFETGFEKGGQTREHAMLAKTAGVKHLVVLINKMDDPTVNWDENRYNECKEKLLPYLKKLGFNPLKDLTFMPCSGLTGAGLKEPLDSSQCPWFTGSPFIPFIDDLPPMVRFIDRPFIMPIVDKYKDMGTVVMGKVEAGEAKKGQTLLVLPNKSQVTVDQLWTDDEEVTAVGPGENVKIKLKGIEEDDISSGFVLCDPSNTCKTGRIFDAQVVILEHKSIICAGYSAVCHIHTLAEEVTVKNLICLVDKKTNEKSKTRPRFVKQDQIAIMRLEAAGVICMEPFKTFPQMGRFTLRDEGRTIAIGKVLKVIE